MRKRNLISLLIAFTMILAACATTGSEDTTTTAGDTGGDTAVTTAPAETGSDATATTTTEVDPKADWPETIIFGFIPSERQEKLADTIEPFMIFLSKELGIEVEGIITADYNGLVVAMGAGQADLGAFGPFGYVQAKDQYPTIEVLIQSIRFGSDLYHGQWFTNDPSICDDPPVVGALENVDGTVVLKDSTEVKALQVGWKYGDEGLGPEVLDDGRVVDQGLSCIASLDNVRGKKIAFTSATSTSGGVFPQLQLLNLGIDLEEDIDYEYLGSHDNTVAAVYNGDFDIGLSYDDARRTMRKDNTDVGTKVIVFNITGEIPNDIVAVRGELPDSLKQAIFDATAKYLATEEGEAVFDDIYGWTDIRAAVDSDFDVVREAAVKLGVTE